MSWFSQKIAAYEQMRFDQEPSRRRLPFSWGLEHIGGPVNASPGDARSFLEKWATQTLAHSAEWYSAGAASDYSLDRENILTFSSAIASPWPENNLVRAQYFPARPSSPAVVVLAQWNSRWEEQQAVCRYLNFLGITAVKLSLPYHDRRAIPNHPRADHLVAPNIGLTLQANRQAVLDVRRTLRWLESQGHSRLGILGTSIGSCLAFLTLVHEPALRAGAFLHVSTYFADVVARGLTTSNVWECLAPHVSLDDLRRYWSPISPFPYVPRLHAAPRKILAITARYDPTFPFDLTSEFLAAVQNDGIAPEILTLPCGHYSLGVAPFKYAVGYRFGTFLRKALA
ncbi:MAG TPA: prolyl oligopeptidase family serine peptidase [Verrucomicrobiae bacterium]|nr:prolyl oligopeptidase family serine peptidase [Verrucomicrobiae bacterium]